MSYKSSSLVLVVLAAIALFSIAEAAQLVTSRPKGKIEYLGIDSNINLPKDEVVDRDAPPEKHEVPVDFSVVPKNSENKNRPGEVGLRAAEIGKSADGTATAQTLILTNSTLKPSNASRGLKGNQSCFTMIALTTLVTGLVLGFANKKFTV